MDSQLHHIDNSLLLDNSNEALNMVNAISVLTAHPACRTIKIATGYWDIPGTSLVLKTLEQFLEKEGTKVQLLIGADPVARVNQLKNPLYKDAKFPQDYIKRDIHELEVKEEYVSVVRLIREYCKNDETESKLQIRIYQKDDEGNVQFFHSKCYIFLGENYAKGIIGSSNFTQKGLQGNSELNYLEWDNGKVSLVPNEYSHSKGHVFWFDEKWKLSESWNQYFLEEVLHGSPIDKKAEEKETAQRASEDTPLTPYELYIKLLNYKFGDIVDLNQQQLIESYLPKRYNPLDYQIQAVKQCFSIMREHGGFMLADVVGLGKTIVGALVIKHFLTMPDDDGRERKVLVITPPAIRSAWLETLEEFDQGKDNKMMPLVDFVTTGSIGNIADVEDDVADSGEFDSALEFKNYGMILIDESHRFRNSQTAMYQSLNKLIGDIGSATGFYPYIGLLSATPQNNRPADLQNQIYLFERNHTDSTLKKARGGNLEGYFSAINKKYAELIAAPKDEDGEVRELTAEEKALRRDDLKALSQDIRDHILEDILVRRTRTDIQRYYGGSLKFPEISGPHMLKYKMEDDLAKLFAETMNCIAPNIKVEFMKGKGLGYYRYRAIEFLLDSDIKALYKGGNIDPDRYSRQLAKIMQTNLVKRIESSFSAFKTSLANLRQYTQNMIEMWEANTIFICPDINVNAELDREKKLARENRLCTFAECVDDLRKKIKRLVENGRNEKKRNRELTRDSFNEKYIECLRKDLTIIEFLCKRWNAYSYDPKLEAFKRCLTGVLFDKQRNPAQKLVIFSEAIDTVDNIKLAVETTNPSLRVLTVKASNRDDLEQTIQENFDANYKGTWKDDYQVIIATEVLAEGINLHRANCILNYDAPWNATRLMQRIGRVNRIGSTADTVYVYNFMPSAQGDAQIQLVQKAYTKLQSFHTLFGEDSKVFTSDEEVMHYDLNIQVNGEESPMEKYISELKEYKAANPLRFEQIVAKESGLELAIPTGEGNSYFLVRNKRLSGMFVKVDKDGKAQLLSGIDMYCEFRTNPDVQTCQLPDDWDKRKAAAELEVNRALNHVNLHVRNSEKATLAKEIITRMKNELTLSKSSRKILANAFNFISNGNIDIINKVIALDKNRNSGPSLFELKQDEIDDILEREIQKIVERVQVRNGKAEVYMALSK